MKPMVNGETNGIVSLGFKIIFKTFENFLNVKIYLLLPLSGGSLFLSMGITWRLGLMGSD